MRSYKKDVYRYYGKTKETLAQKIRRPLELKYIIMFRKGQKCKSRVFRAIYRYRLKKLSNKSHISIPLETTIGEGFYIGHTGRCIINPASVLGRNVNISTGCTVGGESRGKRAGCPTIGNNVWIGTNAVIVGKITIGDDVMIAPNAFVNFDVPSHSIVVGNPGKVSHKDNATEFYINNEV